MANLFDSMYIIAIRIQNIINDIKFIFTVGFVSTALGWKILMWLFAIWFHLAASAYYYDTLATAQAQAHSRTNEKSKK